MSSRYFYNADSRFIVSAQVNHFRTLIDRVYTEPSREGIAPTPPDKRSYGTRSLKIAAAFKGEGERCIINRKSKLGRKKDLFLLFNRVYEIGFLGTG